MIGMPPIIPTIVINCFLIMRPSLEMKYSYFISTSIFVTAKMDPFQQLVSIWEVNPVVLAAFVYYKYYENSYVT